MVPNVAICYRVLFSIDAPVMTWIIWIIQYEAKRTTKPIIAEVIVLLPSLILSGLPALLIMVKPPTKIMIKIMSPAAI